MIDWSTCPAVERDPERVSRAWVFRGTRVPVAALFENLEDGAQVAQFVQWFPGVSLEQVRVVLEHVARSALASAWVARVLLDRGTPVPLRESLSEHDVSTAYERGWATLKNSDLLDAAEREGFEVLVTTDRNLRHQQNLRARSIAIVVRTTTSWPRIQRDIPAVVRAVNGAVPGSYVEAQFPTAGQPMIRANRQTAGRSISQTLPLYLGRSQGRPRLADEHWLRLARSLEEIRIRGVIYTACVGGCSRRSQPNRSRR